MAKVKISVFFVTLNEAQTIEAAIRSVAGVDEIVVVDSGSSDGTVDICQRLGAKVIHQEWMGFAKQKAFALEQCRNEWCFNLDGDEVVTAGALAEIQGLVENDQCDLIRLPFEDVFMSAPMHHLSRKRSIIRVFKKSKASYPTDKTVHENVISRGRVLKIKNHIIHYGYCDAATLMDKQNKYSSLGAQDKFKKGKRASRLKLLLVFPLIFLKCFLLRKLFLSGTRGFIQAYIEAMYAFLKEAKLYELEYLEKEEKDSKR